ncbi:MAG TPA: hypothetical protein DDW52_10160 [Planctomycetaceae bacterium]|nr:hypothetical protein [Planctomycetaceae bacterium]
MAKDCHVRGLTPHRLQGAHAVKKFWLHSLALALGLVGSTNALGQYPGAYNPLGASAYPVSAPQQQLMIQSLPQVPNSYYSQPAQSSYALPAQNSQPFAVPNNQLQQPFQLVATQDPSAIYNQSMPAEQIAPGAAVNQSQNLPMPASATGGHTSAPANHYSTTMAPAVNQGAVSHGGVVGQSYVPTYSQTPTVVGGCQSCQTGGPIIGVHGAAPISSGGPISGGCGPVGYGGGYCAPAAPAVGGFGPSPWFFGGGVLLFNRIDHANKNLSFFDSSYTADTLSTHDARMGIMPGFEVFGGRYFNCGRNAIQFSYFGIFSDDEVSEDARSTGGDYRSRNRFNYVDILNPAQTAAYGAPTSGVYDWYDAAFTHRLERSSEFHNIEVNLLGFAIGGAGRTFGAPFVGGSMFGGLRGHNGGCFGGGGCASGSCGGACGHTAGCGLGGGCLARHRGAGCGTGCGAGCGLGNCCGGCGFGLTPGCGSRCSVGWLMGFRYFRFEDNLTYAASLQDSMISRAADDLYYDVNTTNDLFGFQLGSRLNYCLGKRANLWASCKGGVYGNHSTLYTRLATEFQNAYLNDTRTPTNPNNGQAYIFNESKDTVAFLGEIGAGVGLRLTCRWTANFGYRAIFANGVATSVDNYRETFANYAAVRNYDPYGTLVIHGVDIGAAYNF